MKLSYQGWTYETISSILGCTPGFVSQNKQAYQTHGVEALKLKYRGSIPFLSAQQREAVIAWLKEQNHWSLEQLRAHILAQYDRRFQSDQSYYDLLHDAKITYKKAQPINPKRDATAVAAKKKK